MDRRQGIDVVGEEEMVFFVIWKERRARRSSRTSLVLPDDEPSSGDVMLGERVNVAVSESVSMHERIAATVALGIDRTDAVPVGVVAAGVRRRKLTRLRND